MLELCEIFEEGYEKSSELAFKALSRRAMAFRGLYNWAGAAEDLREAIKLRPADKEAREMLKKTQDAEKEARYAEEVRLRKKEED